MQAGRPFDIRPTGPSDIRRIEGGILNHGTDITSDTNEFLGREAWRRVRAEGVKQRLVGIEIEGAQVEFNMTSWPVNKGGNAVGQMTSAIYSPWLKKRRWAQNWKSRRLAASRAVVVPTQFVDPGKVIPEA